MKTGMRGTNLKLILTSTEFLSDLHLPDISPILRECQMEPCHFMNAESSYKK
jgi:hypothetical protein